MSGLFEVTVSEARGFVAIPADIDKLAVVIGCSSAGSGLSSFFLSGSAAVAGVGYGDAVDTLTQIIEQKQPSSTRKFPAAIYTTPATTTGSYGTVDSTGETGTAVVTAHSATKPFGTYHARLKVVNGGLIGTAGITFQWSLDDGRSYSVTTALGTATTYTIPNSGVQFDFAPASADLTALNTLLNELKTDYEAHRVLTAGSVHGAADSTNTITAADATNTATRVALANDLRAKYNAHRILTAGGVHGAADTTNVITAPVATDDSTALILALDLKAKYNAHIVLTAGGVHGAADGTNTTTSPNPSAGALIAGDVIKCRTFAPAPAAADIDTAFTALAQSTIDFALVVCEFPMTATLAAHVSTGLAALRNVGKRAMAICRTRLPDFEMTETESAWATSVSADYAAFTDSTIHVRATYGIITDAVTGRQYRRSDLAQYAADVVRTDRPITPDLPADQKMENFSLVDENGNQVGHDEGPRGTVTGLSNDTLGNRFGCNQRFPDQGRREDVFSTVPWVMYASDERIRNVPVRRIANAMERVAVTAGTSDLGANLAYNPTTKRLTAASRKALQGKMFRALSPEFAKDIQNARDAGLDTGLVQVDPNVTVTGGNLLKVKTTLAPLVFGILLDLDIVLAIQQ